MRAEKDEMLEKHFQKWCVSALVEGSLNKYEREEKKKEALSASVLSSVPGPAKQTPICFC